jgi:hypothetical protein
MPICHFLSRVRYAASARELPVPELLPDRFICVVQRTRSPVVLGPDPWFTGAPRLREVTGMSAAGGADLVGTWPPHRMAKKPSTRKRAARLPPIQIPLGLGVASVLGLLRSCIGGSCNNYLEEFTNCFKMNMFHSRLFRAKQALPTTTG